MGVTVYILYSAYTRIFFTFGFVQTYYMFSRAVGVRFLNVIISLDLSFHQLSNAVFEIVILQKLVKIQRKENGKSKMMAWLFFIFWILSNIFRNFSGCRRPIFNCYYIIRFVFSLAFQRRIRNCSTAKTREDIAKRKRKVENEGQLIVDKIFRGFQRAGL